MEKIIVTTDTKDNARIIANMLKQLSFVDNVQIESELIQSEKSKKDAFIYAGNPMSENDIMNLISECESEPYFTSNEARQLSLKILQGWEKQNR
jgi:hypothetical protein